MALSTIDWRCFWELLSFEVIMSFGAVFFGHLPSEEHSFSSLMTHFDKISCSLLWLDNKGYHSTPSVSISSFSSNELKTEITQIPQKTACHELHWKDRHDERRVSRDYNMEFDSLKIEAADES